MKQLAIVSLLLVLTLVAISAYLRLDHSGIGCQDWPHCYGMIGGPDVEQPSVRTTYERLARDAAQPLSWATPAHRLVASVLGLCIVAMTLLSLWQKRARLISIALLTLTVFLAWLGIYSGGLHSPAIVMGNLCGGFTMLALLGWMVFRDFPSDSDPPRKLRGWTVAALLLLCGQIALGGLTSANFAASACLTLPDCHGSFLPGTSLAIAFDLTRSHRISSSGFAVGGTERADIHKLHRIGAVIAAAVALFAAMQALRAGITAAAAVVATLVIAEVSVGVAAIASDLPIGIAVAHNWLAALLLLSLLRLLALCKSRQAPHINER